MSLYDDGGVMVTQKSCMVGTFLNALSYPPHPGVCVLLSV